jgi:hypothetical protein
MEGKQGTFDTKDMGVDWIAMKKKIYETLLPLPIQQ